jgi:Holliday junction resolvase RusA-like endonuclease
MTTLTLPFPPTVNNLFRNVPGKGRVRTGHYRLWLQEAALLLRAQRAPSLKGSYRLTISAVRPDNRRRDIANLEKAVSDCLVHAGVIEDDHMAQSILLMWSDSAPIKGGAITIHLEAA